MLMVTHIDIESVCAEPRIFDKDQDSEFLGKPNFSESLYYDVRHDLPDRTIRNKRDSRFFPGTKHAGVRGITKNLLYFIQKRVNPLGFEVSDQGRSRERNTFEEGYEKNIEYTIDNDVHEASGFFVDFGYE